MKLNKDNIEKKRGSVLLSTLIAIIILSAIIASLNAVLSYTRSSVEKTNVRVQARLLAEEGVEEAFWYVRQNTMDSDPTWSSSNTGNTTIYTRTDSGLSRDNRIGLIEQTVSRTTLPTGGTSSYLYTIEAVARVTSVSGIQATDGLTVSTEDLAIVQDLAGMRLMDNARSEWQLDQIGTYDSSIDPISGLDLYSYDSDFVLDTTPNLTYAGQTLQNDPGFDLLLSYEPLDLFIGSWGHAPQGSNIPYVSYYSRDLAGGGGTSSAINIYYARRTDVEDIQNTTLVPGDGKTFFDFITGANEAESLQAAQDSNGTTDFDNIDTEAEILAFQDELTSNINYFPDNTQYIFHETAGNAPIKNPFDGAIYEHTPYFGGKINLRAGSINTATADSTPSGATASSASRYNNKKNILIQGGSVSNDQPVRFEVNSRGNVQKNIIVDSGSNVILHFNRTGFFQTDTIQVRDGGKLTIHMGPGLDSFNAQSAALALSSDPGDLMIIDEPSSSIDANGNTMYHGTNVALGDPYRQYEPYKALNLDNANHPTVATIYAPHSTVYTDHFAGVVISEHFQSHGVIMFDRHTLKNNYYINNLIDNTKSPFKTPTVRRKLYASVAVVPEDI